MFVIFGQMELYGELEPPAVWNLSECEWNHDEWSSQFTHVIYVAQIRNFFF